MSYKIQQEIFFVFNSGELLDDSHKYNTPLKIKKDFTLTKNIVYITENGKDFGTLQEAENEQSFCEYYNILEIDNENNTNRNS